MSAIFILWERFSGKMAPFLYYGGVFREAKPACLRERCVPCVGEKKGGFVCYVHAAGMKYLSSVLCELLLSPPIYPSFFFFSTLSASALNTQKIYLTHPAHLTHSPPLSIHQPAHPAQDHLSETQKNKNHTEKKWRKKS